MENCLTLEEFANPHIALDNIFQCFTTFEMIELLKQSKKWLIERSFNHEKGTIPYDDTVYFFEKMEKLLQASWLLHRQYISQLIQNDSSGKVSGN